MDQFSLEAALIWLHLRFTRLKVLAAQRTP